MYLKHCSFLLPTKRYKVSLMKCLYTLSVAVSFRSSSTTAARASGLTPASSNWTQTLSVSSSNPVLSKSDISLTAKVKRKI